MKSRLVTADGEDPRTELQELILTGLLEMARHSGFALDAEVLDFFAVA